MEREFTKYLTLAVQNRCRLFRKAQDNLQADQNWTFASSHFGIETFYRREEDETLSIKLEGDIKDVPLFEQVCVLKEVDLHYKWAPFCSSSMTIAELDKLDMVGWFLIGMPNFGVSRDGCFRAIGCDNIMEDGSILLCAQGVNDLKPGAPPLDDIYLSNDPILEKLDIPPLPKRRGAGRMTIRKFDAMIRVDSPTSARTHIVANVDPNLGFLPNSLLDFIMKHLAGVMLSKLQAAAKTIPRNPKRNEHAKRMRAESDFYQKWLMAKFQAICDQRGWEMPHVSAFDYIDPEAALGTPSPNKRGFHRAATYNGHSNDDLMDTSEGSPGSLQRSDEEMSELTSRSGSGGAKNNPIAQYLREMEERTQRKKMERLAETRRKAAARLRPKELSLEKQERLEELKRARARRRAGTWDASMGTTNEPEPRRTLSQAVTARLHSHDRFTRFLVIVILVKVLFAMLHPDTILKLTPILPKQATTWSSPLSFVLAEDIIAILYIMLCSVPHFVLCDVALVYAFSSLELGMKSGQKLKEYYSNNVRATLALGSGAIVGISLLKALMKVWFRFALWSTVQAYGVLKETLSSFAPGTVLPSWVVQLTSIPANYGMAIFSSLVRIANESVSVFMRYFVRSNMLGLEAEFIVSKGYRLYTVFVRGIMQFMYCFVQDTIQSFEDGSERETWREEAFETARTLFSYTAVFLLTSLILFTLTARRSRHPEPLKTPRTPDGPAIRNQFSNMSSVSDASGVSSSRLRAATYDPIPEENAVVVDSPRSLHLPPGNPDEISISSSTRLSNLRNRRFNRGVASDSRSEPNVLSARPRFHTTEIG